MNDLKNIDLWNFNLVTGSNSDYYIYQLAKLVKDDPGIDFIEINPGDDNIIRKLDKVVEEMNCRLDKQSKETKQFKPKWIIIDDYISCSFGYEDRLERNLIEILHKGRLANFNILIGVTRWFFVSANMRDNMKVIKVEDIKDLRDSNNKFRINYVKYLY